MLEENYRPLCCSDCGLAKLVSKQRGRPRTFCLDCRPTSYVKKPIVERPKKPAVPKPIKSPRACIHCTGLNRRAANSRYCSNACKRAEEKVAKHKRVPLLTGTAAVCAAPSCRRQFVRTDGNQIYCERACGERYEIEQRLLRNSDRRDKTPRPCGWCGVPFAPGYGDNRSRFCSRICKKAHHNKTSSGSSHRRRARAANAPYEVFEKHSVFERDGWRCQICGTRTPKSKCGSGDDNEPVLDHVISFTRPGAAHTLDNVQCACRRCNTKKHAGPPAGQIGLFTDLLNDQIKARRRRTRQSTNT